MGQKSIVIQEEINELQHQLEEHSLEYIPPVNHYFADGMYCREMFALAGTTAVGATHKKDCINLLTEGEIVITDGSIEPIVIKAPQIFVSKAGKQKIIHFLTDSIVVNVFRTSATTVEEADKECVVEDFKELQGKTINRMLEKDIKWRGH